MTHALTEQRVRTLTAAAHKSPTCLRALAEAIGLDAPSGVADPLAALTIKIERLEAFGRLPKRVRVAAWGACFADAVAAIQPLKVHAGRPAC